MHLCVGEYNRMLLPACLLLLLLCMPGRSCAQSSCPIAQLAQCSLCVSMRLLGGRAWKMEGHGAAVSGVLLQRLQLLLRQLQPRQRQLRQRAVRGALRQPQQETLTMSTPAAAAAPAATVTHRHTHHCEHPAGGPLLCARLSVLVGAGQEHQALHSSSTTT